MKTQGKTENPPARRSERLAFLDWSRGMAAVIMLQGHVFHSFTAKDLRESGPYVLSQFVGGMPPAIFLFLTGVTLGFMLDAAERRGEAPWRRVRTAWRRAGYLLALAFAFRLQLWVFGQPSSPWTDLFRVDILNSMALAIAVAAPMAVFTTMERVRLCAVLGVGIAAASPIISTMNWSGLHPFVRGYIVPDYVAFAFFPWAAFVAFGVSAGSILRLTRGVDRHRTMQWAAMAGFGLILGGRYFSAIPYSIYQKSEFWLDSPALTFIKLGVILLLIAFAYLWTEHAAGASSWVCLLGTHSLLVYWVHTELVYGRWTWVLRDNLSIGQGALASVVVIAMMVGLALLKRRWAEVRAWLVSIRQRAAAEA
jgi:uncharacterized membrane protein